MRRFAALWLCFPLVVPAGELSKATGELRIAAASDLKFALDEIVVLFRNSNPRKRRSI